MFKFLGYGDSSNPSSPSSTDCIDSSYSSSDMNSHSGSDDPHVDCDSNLSIWLSELKLMKYCTNFQNMKVKTIEDLLKLEAPQIRQLIPDVVPRKRLEAYINSEKQNSWMISTTDVTYGEKANNNTFSSYRISSLHLNESVVGIDSATIERVVENVEELTKEVKLLFRLRHPNVLRLYGISDSDSPDKVLIHYERLPNMISFSNFNTSQLSLIEKCEIMLQIAEGMNYLHERRVYPRNLHMSTILISQQQEEGEKNKIEVKICNYGNHTSAEYYSIKDNIDGIGGVEFISRESFYGRVLKKEERDYPNIYSFGILFCSLICGELPFKDLREKYRNKFTFLLNIHPENGDSQTPSKKLLKLSDSEENEDLTDLLYFCLDQDIRNRPRMSDIVEELKFILSAMRKKGMKEGESSCFEDVDDSF